jgi:hypothetical protein
MACASGYATDIGARKALTREPSCFSTLAGAGSFGLCLIYLSEGELIVIAVAT